MSNDLIIFVIFGLILTVLFVLVFIKDLEASRKFSRYEKAIEGLIQNMVFRKFGRRISQKKICMKNLVIGLNLAMSYFW